MLNSDSFIGSEFPTPNGGVLKVERLVEPNSLRYRLYEVSCSKCSKDTELWPAGLMRSTKANLIKGALPCGCAKSRQMTEQQRSILIRRKAEGLGFGFCGFSESWKGKDTKLVLLCGIHGVWRTSTMHSFMTHGGCPACGMQRTFKAVSKTKRILDDDWVERFLATGKYHDKISFKRQFNIERWIVSCEICASDVYASAGLCNGEFDANQQSLANGDLPCRCAGTKRLTPMQRELQASMIAESEGYSFVGWDGEYENPKTRAIFNCPDHGNFKLRYDSFLYAGTRCTGCFGACGFQRDKPSYVYTLESECGAYIKVGISNQPERRHKALAKATPFEFYATGVYQLSGADALNLETGAHRKFMSAGFTGFDGATEWLRYDPDIIQYIEERAM